MIRTWIVAALACVTFFLVGCQSVDGIAESGSNLAGLASLKSLGRDAMPYEEAIANGRPTLVEFYADWCTTCQGMAPMVQQLHRQQPDLNFVAIDIDEPRWAETIARYGVTGVPKFIVLDRAAAEVETFVGGVPQSVLERAISRAS